MPIGSMPPQPTGKRKSWLTDSLSIQSPNWGSPPQKDNTGRGTNARRDASVEKYSMYLNGTAARPRTTPFNAHPPPSSGQRLYVNHAGGALSKAYKGDMGRARGEGVNTLRDHVWTRAPGTAPPPAISSLVSKWAGHFYGGDSSFNQVLASMSGTNTWMNNGRGTWSIPAGKAVGQPAPRSPYGSTVHPAGAQNRKPKRVVSPKKEIANQKLMKEMRRSKERINRFRPGTTMMANRQQDAGCGTSNVFLSQRLGEMHNPLTRFPFAKQGHSRGKELRPGTQSRKSIPEYLVCDAPGSNRNGPAPNYRAPTFQEATVGTSGIDCPQALHHPLHRTTVDSRQQAMSRASYCQQLSMGWPPRGFPSGGASITAPDFDPGDCEVATTSGRDHGFRGGKLVCTGSLRSPTSERQIFVNHPPQTAPLLDLDGIPPANENGPPSPHGHVWTNAGESPRVKGWKITQSKVGGADRKGSIESCSSLAECDLQVSVETGNRPSVQTTAEEEHIHELLEMCASLPEPEGAGNKGGKTSDSCDVEKKGKCTDNQGKEGLSRDATMGKNEGGSDSDDGMDVEESLSQTTDSTSTSETEAVDSNDTFKNGFRVLGGKYEVLNRVGEGAYGLVMKCKARGTPGKFVAVKEFKLEDDDPDAEEVKRTMNREVQLLHDLQHRHVVRFIEHFRVGEKVFIVMEFVPKNLLELLEERAGKGLEKSTVRTVIFQVVRAIAFIHGRGAAYRDLKPENLLIGVDGTVMLCDFGFARYVTDHGELMTDYVATRWYRAPELLLGPPFKSGGGKVQCPYGKAVDMWAIGCLMGELIDGEPLFAGDSDIDQLYKIQQILGPITDSHRQVFERNPSNQGIVFNIKTPMTLDARYEGKVDAQELDFMRGLLHLDPAKRRTGDECLKHPYFDACRGQCD